MRRSGITRSAIRRAGDAPPAGVQSVTGTAPIVVDNTDPANPVVELDPMGVVVGVTGDPAAAVDNTDPANPIVRVGLILVAEIAPLGGTTDSLEFAGLAGDDVRLFEARFRFVNGDAGATQYAININGAATGITVQRLYGAGASPGADQTSALAGINAGSMMEVSIEWNPRAGLRRHMLVRAVTDDGAAADAAFVSNVTWDDDATEVTAFSIEANTAAGFGLLSSAELWARI